MTTKCVIYVRGNGANRNYLIEQKEKCEDYAKRNGLEIIGLTEDFNALLTSKADAVLVAMHNRISRDPLEYHFRTKLIERAGMKLISVGNR